MSKNTITISLLVLAVYILLEVFHPGGLMAYIFPSTCWTILALVTLKVCGSQKIRSWFNKRIFIVAIFIGVIQIFTFINIGLFTGFGRNPASFTPRGLTINAIFISTALLGTELSRAYLIRKGRKKPFLTIALITLLYTSINVSIVTLLNFEDPLAYSRFLGTTYLPTLTLNLLASYLALLAGPIASLAYLTPLKAFQWFSPILPDLPWGYEALIGVMAPTIGLIVISQAAPPALLKKIGISTKPERPSRFRKAKKPSIRGWTIVSVLCLLMVWASTGLLGFYPTIVASGSMRPTMEVGDMAIIISTDPSKIKTGDVIQYWQEEGDMTLHRVVETRGEGSSRVFVTMGDANTAPDTELVFPAQIRGKLILTIPKIGWISIYLKTAIASVWSFFSTNITLAYGILTTLTLGAITCAYKNRSNRKWKRS